MMVSPKRNLLFPGFFGAEVRRWCHPKFSLPARPLSADLAAGQHVNNEEASGGQTGGG